MKTAREVLGKGPGADETACRSIPITTGTRRTERPSASFSAAKVVHDLGSRCIVKDSAVGLRYAGS